MPQQTFLSIKVQYIYRTCSLTHMCSLNSTDQSECLSLRWCARWLGQSVVCDPWRLFHTPHPPFSVWHRADGLWRPGPGSDWPWHCRSHCHGQICKLSSTLYGLVSQTVIKPSPTLHHYITFKSFSRRSYPERLTNWCIHLMASSGTVTLQ
jgi:hypothetical protein